jgi:hypothetical protein
MACPLQIAANDLRLCLPGSSLNKTTCHRLFSIHFPCLHSLTLGHNIWAMDEIHVTTDFTEFIMRHSDTLEDIDVEYDQHRGFPLAFNQRSLARLCPNTLPRLHSFKGNMETLMMFDAILSPGGDDPSLRYFSKNSTSIFPNGVDHEQEDTIVTIRNCAIICASLKVWKSSVPDAMMIEANKLARLGCLTKWKLFT